MEDGPLHEIMDQYVNGWRIPAGDPTSGVDRVVRVGPCVYGRYPGVFVYIVSDALAAYGLCKDGQWRKYGDDFKTGSAAFRALLGEHEGRITDRFHDQPKAEVKS